MASRDWLRIHMVGSASTAKESFAARLEAALKVRKLGSVVLIEDAREAVSERLETDREDHHYFFTVENEYMKYETSNSTRGKNLIFVDSLVDRYLDSKKVGVNLELYFSPRLGAADENFLFLYGPTFTEDRSEVIRRFQLPVHVWNTLDETAVEAAVEAASLRLRNIQHGKRKKR